MNLQWLLSARAWCDAHESLIVGISFAIPVIVFFCLILKTSKTNDDGARYYDQQGAEEADSYGRTPSDSHYGSLDPGHDEE